MNNIVNVIEIGSSCVKLIVGYKHDKDVFVQYANLRVLNMHSIVDGNIVDHDDVSKNILELIKDGETNLKREIKEVVLVLPSIGLEVFSNTRDIPALSTNYKISETDIRNVITTVFKDKYPTSNEVIDVLPITYCLDNNAEYSNPPIGEESSMLTLKANVHTLPKSIVDDYKKCVENSNATVISCVASPYGIAKLLSPYKEIPDEYFLVSMGAKVITVTMISNGEPYKSMNIFTGGNSITQGIQNRFGISYESAEHLKIVYGLDNSKYDYLPYICTSETTENAKFNARDVSLIVEDELASIVRAINRCLKSLSDDETFENLPVVFVGGASKMYGIKEFMQQKIERREVIFPQLKTIGARDMTYIDALGGIKITSSVMITNKLNVENKPQVLTRDVVKMNKYSETDDKL